jgi:putative transposase
MPDTLLAAEGRGEGGAEMPWSRGPVDERKRMIAMWQQGHTPTELASEFNVSRQTIYDWLWRWEREGAAGLEDRSRAPHSSPRQTSAGTTQALLDIKDRYPRYGPDKLVRLLKDDGITLSASTARDILRRNGRVTARRARSPRWSPRGESHIVVPGPGHSMTADHKGQFRMKNGRYCYPLTLADPASRYVFAVEALSSTNGALARPVFERVFQEWGLPEQIITDNGPPFCISRSIGGLSPMGKWWIQLRIEHVRITPGRPQQNGIHERMHRTLKELATRPPETAFRSQQKRFDAFVTEFNHVRPHQALGQERPASRVEKYRRSLPTSIAEIEYPDAFEVRRVRSGGVIKWQGGLVFVGEVLIGEPVGLVPVTDDCWHLYYGPRHLANWNAQTRRFEPAQAENAR